LDRGEIEGVGTGDYLVEYEYDDAYRLTAEKYWDPIENDVYSQRAPVENSFANITTPVLNHAAYLISFARKSFLAFPS